MTIKNFFALILALTYSTSSFAVRPNAATEDNTIAAVEVYEQISGLEDVDQIEQIIETSGLTKNEILGAGIRIGRISLRDLEGVQQVAMDNNTVAVIVFCTPFALVAICTLAQAFNKDKK